MLRISALDIGNDALPQLRPWIEHDDVTTILLA